MAAPVAASSASVMNITGSSVQAIVTKPTGTVSGDLIIVQYTAYFQVAGSSFTPASGFTLIDSKDDPGHPGYPYTALYYKVAGGSEPATYTFTASGTTPYAGGAIAVRVTGADTSLPINAHAANLDTSGLNTYPTVTTTVADTLLLIFGANDDQSTQTGATFPTAVPSGFTLVNTGINGADTLYIGAAAKAQTAIGATGGFTAAGASWSFEGFTVAIAPTAASSFTGTISATLGAVTSSISGSFPFVGDIASTLGPVTSAIAGLHGIVGDIGATLDPVTSSITAYLSVGGTIAATLAPITMSAIGGQPVTGTISVSLAEIAASITGVALQSTAYPWHPPSHYFVPFGSFPPGYLYLPIWEETLSRQTIWTASGTASTSWSTPTRASTVWRT